MRIAHRVATVLTTIALLAPATISSAQSVATSPIGPTTATPIKHVVAIFQENVSFDHYFGTYPSAANPGGEPRFTATTDTPSVNGLDNSLLTNNPNAAKPFRLDRSQAVTCDMDHGYTVEQKAYDAGLVDRFVQSTGAAYDHCDRTHVMGYYDGNTVTALWNYAQHYAMSDNSFGTTFGPSTPGALNLVSGQTHGATPSAVRGKIANGTVYSDLDPTFDDCSKGTTAAMSGKNVGDLLNAKGITWGWFEGGFKPTSTTNGKANCGAKSTGLAGASTDYIPHHEPFQYYQSTANPHHLPPTSVRMVGYTDQANHQYDLTDFWAAARAGNLPAVSFLKAKAYQDGHAGYSDPLDEQNFLVDTLNQLQKLPDWRDTAVVISYDDSDGWYDHVMPPIVNPSNDVHTDALAGAGNCGTPSSGAYLDRCGYGPRLPLLVISPWARVNYVDHRVTDQSSILRFIEDNWGLGRIGDQSFDTRAGSLNGMFDWTAGPRNLRLILDPATGEPASADASHSSAVHGVLRPGSWVAYTFSYPGDGSEVGLTLTYRPNDSGADEAVTLDAYGPTDPPPSGTPIGSATLQGKPGVKFWQLSSKVSGTYVLLVRNQDLPRRSMTFTLTTTSRDSSGPNLVWLSSGQ